MAQETLVKRIVAEYSDTCDVSTRVLFESNVNTYSLLRNRPTLMKSSFLLQH